MSTTPPKIFISSAPEDAAFRDELKTHLKSVTRANQLTVWDDTQIPVGAIRRDEIKKHLEEADVSILLVTRDFLASDFIHDHQLNLLLATKHRVWIAVGACNYEDSVLAGLQPANDPAKPLNLFSGPERDVVWTGILQSILATLLPVLPFACAVTEGRFHVPYERNAFFTGRDELLADLHQTLQQDKTAALSQSQAIFGLGGVGKTQTAVEYAYRHFYDAPDYSAVFWVRAETEEEIRQGFVQMARQLNLLPEETNTPDNAVPAVQGWLENPQNAGWLLIFDNADTPDLLRSYKCQRPQGTTLLTSRNRNFGKLGIRHPLAVHTWNRDKAIEFLYLRTDCDPAELSEEERQAAEKIAELLGGLPLALEQAGAYIVERETTFAVYHRDYQRRAARLLRDYPPDTGEYRDQNTQEYRTVWTTWELNFEAVRKEAPASAEALTFSAFLAPDPIPGELLLLGAEHIGEATAALVAEEGREWAAYDTLLLPLTRYSLAQKDSERYAYTVHRLVQQVLRDRLDETLQREQAERVAKVLYAAHPGYDFAKWERCERLLPHWRVSAQSIRRAALVSVEAGSLLNQIGYYLHDRGQYTEAEALYQQALELRRTALPESHPHVATSLNNLADLYRSQGRYAEAEPLDKQVLDIHRLAYGETHPKIAGSLNNLAALYYSQGRYDEAGPLLVQALEIVRAALPEGHPNIATSLNNLAALYEAQGRYAEAEPLLVQALKLRRTALPEGHPDIAGSLNNLAELHRMQGRYAEAETLHKQALDIRRTALPEGHPDIAGSLNNLAALYKAQGRYAEAEPLYKQALDILVAGLGERHPNTIIVLNNYRMMLGEHGREEAIAVFLAVKPALQETFALLRARQSG